MIIQNGIKNVETIEEKVKRITIETKKEDNLKPMLKNKIWSFAVILLLLFSCDSKQVFDRYKTVGQFWHKDSIVSFQVKAPDTINNYNLYINLRNNSNYKYSNLFLIVEMDYPNGKVQTDTLQYDMAKPNGEFLGTGFGDVKENKLWYKGYEKPFKFDEIGEYTFKIQQAMRENGAVEGVTNLEGITDVGFRVEHRKTQM